MKTFWLASVIAILLFMASGPAYRLLLHTATSAAPEAMGTPMQGQLQIDCRGETCWSAPADFSDSTISYCSPTTGIYYHNQQGCLYGEHFDSRPIHSDRILHTLLPCPKCVGGKEKPSSIP